MSVLSTRPHPLWNQGLKLFKLTLGLLVIGSWHEINTPPTFVHCLNCHWQPFSRSAEIRNCPRQRLPGSGIRSCHWSMLNYLNLNKSFCYVVLYYLTNFRSLTFNFCQGKLHWSTDCCRIRRWGCSNSWTLWSQGTHNFCRTQENFRGRYSFETGFQTPHCSCHCFSLWTWWRNSSHRGKLVDLLCFLLNLIIIRQDCFIISYLL